MKNNISRECALLYINRESHSDGREINCEVVISDTEHVASRHEGETTFPRRYTQQYD